MRKGNIRTRVRRLRGCISFFQRARWFLKATALTVVIAFLGLYFQPVALAAHQAGHAPTPQARTESNEEQLARTLEAVEDRLEKLDAKLTRRQAAEKENADLKALRQDLDAQDQKAIEDFDAIAQHLKDKNLPQVILDRHYEAVRTYKQEMTTLKANLTAVEQETDDVQREVKVRKAKEHLKAKHKKRARKPLDPNNLPTRRLKQNPNNKPKTTKDQFIHAGLHDNPRMKLAALGDFTYDKLPDASDPAYLSATPDVTLSDAVRVKAEELEYDPIQIYQWVRNNVEWVPSWGSIQGAELTLANLKGNALDTASLLIALLRASGIPARYVHGAIDVPADRFMNWAGGFTDSNSAWDFVSSGGVPVSGVVSGGKVSAFRMEHVWVEAAVDFIPSRGAINKSADSWVALDASFKQRDIKPGFDLTTAVPFDANEYLNQIRAESPVAYYQQKIQDYLDINLPDQVIGRAMGFTLIRSDNSSVLPSSFPNRIVVAASRYGTLPASLRATVQLAFITPGAFEPEVVNFSTADVASKRLTLSYLPASPSDEATIAQHGGDVYSVPPYLLFLTPTLKADGVIVFQAEPIQMGQEHSLAIGYSGPTTRAQSVPHKLISGGYYAVGLNLQGVNHNVLGSKNARLIETLTTLTPETATQDALIGEHLTALMLMWFLSNDGQYRGAAKLYRVATQRTLSAGLSGFVLTVRYFFGIPRSASPNRAQFDVGLEATQATSLDGDRGKINAYLELRGLTGSYNEHGVWEAIHGFDSVSAVKGLQAANAQGVPVYTLTSANFDQIFPLLQLAAEDKQEIAQAIQVGLVAIVPQREITINDWVGAGFIIKDPQTHNGVYRISGGLAGGSSTSHVTGEFIKQIFGRPFGILDSIRESIAQSFVVGTANVESEALDLQCEVPYEDAIASAASTVDAGELIAARAEKLMRTSYGDIGACSGLVIKAYASAGIFLIELGRRHGTGDPKYVPNMFALAQAIGLPAGTGIRDKTSLPLPGDIIFFNHTYERPWSIDGFRFNPNGGNVNCLLEDNAQPTHVAIATGEVLANGVIRFIHAGNPVDAGFMNLADPKKRDRNINTQLRRPPEEFVTDRDRFYCPSDAFREADNPGGISDRAGALFNGFATIREFGPFR